MQISEMLFFLFRTVLAEFPDDLAQFCSVTIDSVFEMAVLLLEFGTLITKEVRSQSVT